MSHRPLKATSDRGKRIRSPSKYSNQNMDFSGEIPEQGSTEVSNRAASSICEYEVETVHQQQTKQSERTASKDARETAISYGTEEDEGVVERTLTDVMSSSRSSTGSMATTGPRDQQHHRLLLDELALEIDELSSSTKSQKSGYEKERKTPDRTMTALEILRLLYRLSSSQKGKRMLQTHTSLLEKIVTATSSFTSANEGVLRAERQMNGSIALALVGMMYTVARCGTNIDLITKSSLRTLLYIVKWAVEDGGTNSSSDILELNGDVSSQSKSNVPKNALRARLQKAKNNCKPSCQVASSEQSKNREHTKPSHEIRDAVSNLLTREPSAYDTANGASILADSSLSNAFDRSQLEDEDRQIEAVLHHKNDYAAADLAVLCLARCISLGEPQSESGQAIKSYASWSRRYIEKVANIKAYLGGANAMKALTSYLTWATKKYLNEDRKANEPQLHLRLIHCLTVFEHMCFMNTQNQKIIASTQVNPSVSSSTHQESIPTLTLQILAKSIVQGGRNPYLHKASPFVFELFSTGVRVLMNLANECKEGYTAIGSELQTYFYNFGVPNAVSQTSSSSKQTLSGLDILASSLVVCLKENTLEIQHFDEFLHALGALTNCVEHSPTNREKIGRINVCFSDRQINFLHLLTCVFRKNRSRLQLPDLDTEQNDESNATKHGVDDTDMSTEDLISAAYITIFLGCVLRGSSSNLLLVQEGFNQDFGEFPFHPPKENIASLLPVLRAFTALQLNAGVLTKEGLNQINRIAEELKTTIYGEDANKNQASSSSVPEHTATYSDPFSFDHG